MKKFILLLFGAGTLSLQAQVGINTEDPKATLDVQGNVIVGETSFTDSGYSVVVRDNSSGELKVVGNAGQNNSAPINLITFKLQNVDGDWVQNYYTGIDSNKFTVVVTEARFYTEGKTVELSPGTGNAVRYNPEHVYATTEQKNNKNQWTLHADFIGGTPRSGNGTWEITCLVINNSLVKVLPNVTSDFKGHYSFDGRTPRGL